MSDIQKPFFSDHPAKNIGDFIGRRIERARYSSSLNDDAPFRDPGVSAAGAAPRQFQAASAGGVAPGAANGSFVQDTNPTARASTPSTPVVSTVSQQTSQLSTAFQTQIDTIETEIVAIEADITTIQGQITALEANQGAAQDFVRAVTPANEPLQVSDPTPGIRGGAGILVTKTTMAGLPVIQVDLQIGHKLDGSGDDRTGTITFTWVGSTTVTMTSSLPAHCSGRRVVLLRETNTTGRSADAGVSGNVMDVILSKEFEMDPANVNNAGHTHTFIDSSYNGVAATSTSKTTAAAVIPYYKGLREKPITGAVTVRWYLLD